MAKKSVKPVKRTTKTQKPFKKTAKLTARQRLLLQKAMSGKPGVKV